MEAIAFRYNENKSTQKINNKYKAKARRADVVKMIKENTVTVYVVKRASDRVEESAAETPRGRHHHVSLYTYSFRRMVSRVFSKKPKTLRSVLIFSNVFLYKMILVTCSPG